MDGVSMKIGDLVKLTNMVVDGGLFGIIIDIDNDELCHYQITWTDGDLTWEFGCDLEVVCK